MPIAVNVSSYQEVKGSGAVAPHDGGQREARENVRCKADIFSALPGTFEEPCNYYFVPLIEFRKSAFTRQVRLIKCFVVAVPIRGVVQSFAVCITRHQTEGVAEALVNFENARL